MDRIDEAVEVALCVRPFAEAKTSGRSMWELIDTATEEDAEAAMRAALLAGVKVLLGEPVAWLEAEPGTSHAELYGSPDYPLTYYRSTITHIGGRKPTKRQEANVMFALYAPSLGEGDGR